MVQEAKIAVPVVAYLRRETLKERHYGIIDNVLGINLRAQEGVTLKRIMEVRDMIPQLTTQKTCMNVPLGSPNSIFSRAMLDWTASWTGVWQNLWACFCAS